MRQFVDECDRRFSREHSIKIHVFQRDPMILRDQWRHDLQVANLSGCLRSVMRLDIPDYNVHVLFAKAITFNQHLVGLANSGTGPKINLQFTKLLSADDR
jgi:hypothetical protein